MASTTQTPGVRRWELNRDKWVMSGGSPVTGRPMSHADPGGVMPVPSILVNTRSNPPVTGTERDGSDIQRADNCLEGAHKHIPGPPQDLTSCGRISPDCARGSHLDRWGGRGLHRLPHLVVAAPVHYLPILRGNRQSFWPDRPLGPRDMREVRGERTSSPDRLTSGEQRPKVVRWSHSECNAPLPRLTPWSLTQQSPCACQGADQQ